MLITNIKLHETGAGFSCRIEHHGRVVTSGKHADARKAYREAEAKLIVKPGFVQPVPIEGHESD